MKPRTALWRLSVASVIPFAFTAASIAQSSSDAMPNRNAVPALTRLGVNHGPENPASVLNLTVWLNLHNKAGLDAAIEQMYEPGSPNYHKWMNAGELAKYSPNAAEIKAVKKELASHHLAVSESPSSHLALRVTGTVADVETAFHTPIQKYQLGGKMYHANIASPQLEGNAAGLMYTVTGLDNSTMQPYARRQTDPLSGQPTTAVPLARANGIFYAGNCFYAPGAVSLTTKGASLPVGQYYGNKYGADPANNKRGTLPPCGYSAAQVQFAYGLPAAYKENLNGAGQTIVIVDAYGSPTIEADANAFSHLNGLPALNSKNFKVIYPLGQPPVPSLGWVSETTLDVEWAHAIAPGAKIDLLVSPSAQNTDFQFTLLYAMANQLGSVISNSYGAPEALVSPASVEAYNLVSEVGAALGISVDFATGDSGDNLLKYGVITPSTPADSPYATAVGGTSLGIPDGSGKTTQTGWGNNITYLSTAQDQVLDPPYAQGFYGGAGGGESSYFLKPAWQKNLPGTHRQQPDVSALADPFTGAEIVVTDPTLPAGQYVEVYGGTSLACPIFSAVWALANQKAGHLLGQAAPIISRLNRDAVTDVVPVSSPTNPAGIIFDRNGPIYYPSATLSSDGVNPLTEFYSALWDATPQGEYLNLSFGTDSSLTITKGWDNVTGYGTPNGLAFIKAAAKQ